MKYEFAVFDFDGTIVDSGEGILNSARYALESMNIAVGGTEELKFFVGPPLLDSFQRYDGVDEKKAELLVAKYRERYRDIGLFECKVYQGIEDMLKGLADMGVKLAVGSSKPKLFVEKLLEHLDFAKYFSFVSAVEMNNSREPKSEIIRRGLESLGCGDYSAAVMVGDRYFDIDGAAEAGLDSIGVLYGYGSRSEFEEHHATYIASSPGEVLELISKQHT